MTVASVAAFIRSERAVFIGALVTGPVFAWFGQRWRVDHAWRGALATAAALCLEPLARIPTDRAIRSSTVLLAEVAVGIAMVAYVATKMLMSAQAGQRESFTAR